MGQLVLMMSFLFFLFFDRWEFPNGLTFGFLNALLWLLRQRVSLG